MAMSSPPFQKGDFEAEEHPLDWTARLTVRHRRWSTLRT
jgi:hypothetical protein